MFQSIFLLTLCSAVTAREPHCSRFHYEEQLLEKVIRSEIRMETLDAAVEKVRTDMEAELQTLRGIYFFKDVMNAKPVILYNIISTVHLFSDQIYVVLCDLINEKEFCSRV